MGLNRNTLRRREKWMRRSKGEHSMFVQTALDTVDKCFMTPEEAKQKYNTKTKIGAMAAAAAGTMTATTTAFASGNAYGTVNKAITFLMNLLQGVGVCFIAFGVVSLAISFQSHDDSQKSKAVMSIVGGAIAVSVKFVLNALGVSSTDISDTGVAIS